MIRQHSCGGRRQAQAGAIFIDGEGARIVRAEVTGISAELGLQGVVAGSREQVQGKRDLAIGTGEAEGLLSVDIDRDQLTGDRHAIGAQERGEGTGLEVGAICRRRDQVKGGRSRRRVLSRILTVDVVVRTKVGRESRQACAAHGLGHEEHILCCFTRAKQERSFPKFGIIRVAHKVERSPCAMIGTAGFASVKDPHGLHARRAFGNRGHTEIDLVAVLGTGHAEDVRCGAHARGLDRGRAAR